MALLKTARFFLFLAGAAVILGGLTPTPAKAGPSELAQNSNVMQCMEQCIRAEGSAEKATCKTRCANISSRPRQQQNCMGMYKQCVKACPSATKKSCRRGCKDRLMQCS